MSHKRGEVENAYSNDSEGFSAKRQRSDDFGSSRGRGFRGRGFRDRGFRGRGGRGRGFRSRGNFNNFSDNTAGGDGENGRGGRGFRSRGGGRFRSREFRGGRSRGNFGGGRGRGARGGRGGRFQDGNTTGGFDKFKPRECSIKVGQDAPDFNNILNHKSESTSLKQFRGKYVVLFIYYKNGTYGSKLEQENFRDLQEKFEKLNATILGVSRDDQASHSSTVKEINLKYPLLVDSKAEITKAYDAIDQSDRVYSSTFIITPEGKIAATWAKVSGADKHPHDVLRKLEKIVNGETSDNETDEKKKTNENTEEQEFAEDDDENDKEDIDVEDDDENENEDADEDIDVDEDEEDDE
jgi:peroxiredoxin Q/BCP